MKKYEIEYDVKDQSIGTLKLEFDCYSFDQACFRAKSHIEDVYVEYEILSIRRIS